MKLPKPEPGLVIRYSYLWRNEAKAGRDEGVKHRPCAIILTALARDGVTEVFVLPISHAPPKNQSDAVEIPDAIKQHLGLDSNRSWVVITESNAFGWPGPDLRPSRNGDLSTVAYGFLPARFFKHVRDKHLELRRLGRSAVVPRSS